MSLNQFSANNPDGKYIDARFKRLFIGVNEFDATSNLVISSDNAYIDEDDNNRHLLYKDNKSSNFYSFSNGQTPRDIRYPASKYAFVGTTHTVTTATEFTNALTSANSFDVILINNDITLTNTTKIAITPANIKIRGPVGKIKITNNVIASDNMLSLLGAEVKFENIIFENSNLQVGKAPVIIESLVTGTIFQNCIFYTHGNAVSNKGKNLYFTNCIFDSLNPGALQTYVQFLDIADADQLHFKECAFIGNDATNPGTTCVELNTLSFLRDELFFSGCQFGTGDGVFPVRQVVTFNSAAVDDTKIFVKNSTAKVLLSMIAVQSTVTVLFNVNMIQLVNLTVDTVSTVNFRGIVSVSSVIPIPFPVDSVQFAFRLRGKEVYAPTEYNDTNYNIFFPHQEGDAVLITYEKAKFLGNPGFFSMVLCPPLL